MAAPGLPMPHGSSGGADLTTADHTTADRTTEVEPGLAEEDPNHPNHPHHFATMELPDMDPSTALEPSPANMQPTGGEEPPQHAASDADQPETTIATNAAMSSDDAPGTAADCHLWFTHLRKSVWRIVRLVQK